MSIVAIIVPLAAVTIYCDTLRQIPGPFIARWTPLWLGYQAWMGRCYLAIDMKYGPVVRIAPTHFSVAHPDAVGIVYGHSHGGELTFDKSQFYDAFVAGTPSVFSTTNRKDHAYKRRIVSQAFSYRALEQFSPFIQTNVATFVSKLDSMCEKEGSIDLLKWFNYLTFDILSDLAFGEPLGMLATGTSVVSAQQTDGTVKKEDAIALVDKREHISAVLGISPWFPWLARILPDPFYSSGRESATGLADFARRNVWKRLNSGAHREDILGKLIAARESEVDTEMIKELVAETVTLLSAGSDTTASSLTALIYFVKTHPQIHRKLTAELKQVIDQEDIPTHTQVKKLEYLRVVINEGLRHYATMATGFPELCLRGGGTFFGQNLPAGTEISVPAFTIQHHDSIWGDPDVFRPERWLESPEKRKYLSRYLLTFGKGPRACVSAHTNHIMIGLACMETQLILATVIHRYNIELESDHLDSTEGFVHKTKHLLVKLSRKF
ncbi:benzoate para-hydroxylase [Mycena albidolilacea]|uniref:Benzoate para-hydroxylase n=1 Tax=Mycena albidolilacea TaxID=1033008 RepID=A0AAD7EAK1_9AGAR|nr:benzoate para-hydroxylase [Mycena albidolilacea]